MKENSFKKALELQSILSQEIAYQESVLENAGECYDGHSIDVDNCKTLLNAIDKYFKDCEKNDYFRESNENPY